MAANQEYQLPKSKSKLPGLELPLAADFYTRPEFTAILEPFGWESVGIVLALGGLMWRRSDPSIRFSEVKAIAYSLHISADRLQDIITGATSSTLFEVVDTHSFHAPFITNAKSDYQTKVNQLRANGRLGGRPKEPTGNQELTKGFEDETKAKPKSPGLNQPKKESKEVDQERKKVDRIEGDPPLTPIPDPDAHPLEKHFAPLTPEIERDPQFMNASRRPLKDFPAIWLSPVELDEVKAEFKKNPSASMKSVFKAVQAWAVARPPHERSKICAHAALTGWGLRDELLKCKAVNDAARSAIYLANAAGEQ